MMESESTYRDIQEGELSVLQSIYDKDVEDLRPKQEKWIPLNIVIHLRPSATDSQRDPNYCSVDLNVVCKANYPKTKPTVTLEKPRGIGSEQLAELQAALTKQASQYKKKEMIYDLCTTVSNYLAENVRPLPEIKGRVSESFYEKMLRDKENEEIRKQQEESERERKNKEQIQSQKEMLNRIRKTNNSESSPRHLSLSLSEAPECDEHRRSENIYLTNSSRRICLGSCLGHSQKGCINYSAIDLSTGQLLFVTEWMVKTADVDKTVESIEKKVADLCKLRHKNLVAYEDVHFVRKRESLQVFLVQEFCQGINVSNCIFSNLDGASMVAKGVLDALIFLHNNGVTHGNLLADNVLMDNAGFIRVTDFSVISHLQELCGSQKLSADLPAMATLLESIMPTPNAEMREFISLCRSDRTLSGSDLVEHTFLVSISNQHSQSPDDFQIAPAAQPSIPHPSANIPMFECTESSRLESEFKVINYIGKGAYGDVMKVQKTLDNKVYAIKRIPLSTRNRQLYKKMIREVELLSRLNHENVVRYYNSWIETSTKPVSDEDSDESEISDKGTRMVRTHSTNHLSAAAVVEESSDEESSSESYGLIGAKMGNDDDEDSDFIIFENSNGEAEQAEVSDESSHKKRSPKTLTKRSILYIQMEFCDKSTLRTAIDNNLYQDEDRLWRLFREIGEGLMHIHQQGMIHRDLKPVNIFLDSKDNVKIGDFGLATTSILALQNQQQQGDANQSTLQALSESQTGQVGTALYVAPELSGKASKSTYTQKVDLYSLGIILYEMSTPPASTGMERIKTLAAVRQPDIKLPKEMEQKDESKNIVQLLKWLLDHNPNKRPTAEELLQSELVPPAKVEAYELQDMVRNVLANSQTTGYKHLIARCLAQECKSLQQVIEYHQGKVTISPVFENVKNKIVQVMRKHGAIEVSTPLLTPYFKPNSLESAVKLMTHSGSVVTLPNDLHLPFLHHIALNGIQNLRRYSIGRVYREIKVHNFHPRQSYECAFDVVTTNRGHFLVDAEVLALAAEIVREFEVLKQRKISLRINHTNLLKGIFSYFAVAADKQKSVAKLVANFLEGSMQKTQVRESLKSIVPNMEQMTDLLLTVEGSITNVKTTIMKVLKGRSESTSLAKGALRELELVTSMSQAMGLDLPINLCPGFTNNYDCSRTGCINWQMIGETKARKMTVFASGGRNDGKLEAIKDKAFNAKIEFIKRDMFCAGFSVAIDKIVLCLNSSPNSDRIVADVVVCVYGSRPPLKDATQILRELWSAGIKSCLFETLSPRIDAETSAKELGASQILMISETEPLKLKSWHTDSYVEQTVNRPDIVSYLKKNLNSDQVENFTEDLHQNLVIARANSIVNASGRSSEASGGVLYNLNIVFICSEKPILTRRKKVEVQIEQKLAAVVQKFNKKESFSIFAVDLDIKQVKNLAGCIEPNPKDQTHEEIDAVLEKFPRHKQKYLREVFDEVVEKIADEKCPCIVGIYSIKDANYRLIL